MKKLLILLLGVVLTGCSVNTASEIILPEPTGYVVDNANLLSTTTEETVKQLIVGSKHEIAVLTVDSISPYTIEEYSIKIAEKWKVGDDVKDDGIIIIIAKAERKVRIEVGYGLEGILNDAKAGRILSEDMVPLLKNNDWDNAVITGVQSITKITNK